MAQMSTENDLKNSFEEEIERIKSETTLSPEFRKRKLIAWAIRTLIAIALYAIFWKHSWVRWTLILYIPLNLLGLLAIYGQNFLINRKIASTRAKIEGLEKQLSKEDEDQ
ncbi:MAG: hypothetical protein AAF599_03610 [Bacteroidota bacterium]